MGPAPLDERFLFLAMVSIGWRWYWNAGRICEVEKGIPWEYLGKW